MVQYWIWSSHELEKDLARECKGDQFQIRVQVGQHWPVSVHNQVGPQKLLRSLSVASSPRVTSRCMERNYKGPIYLGSESTTVFLPGESHGQRSLVGSNPWDCKQSDMTEQQTLSLFKYTSITKSNNHVHWYLPKGVENICLHENFHMDVCNSFMDDYQNVGKPKCPSVGEWINKFLYIWTMEYYSVLKINEVLSHEKTGGTFIVYLLLCERITWQVYILYDSTYMPFWKRQNYGDS